MIQQFTDNTFTFLATQIRAAAGNVPVIYAPGNIDMYLGNAGPNAQFLSDNAGTVYSQFLNSSVDQTTFNSTFTAGGYYSVQPQGLNLLIIALNSNSFAGISPTFAGAQTEIQWLNQQLQSAKAAGQKVWILMHVPPGANAQLIAKDVAVPSDLDESDVSMMWDSATQDSFLSTLGGYPGLITMMLAGHTHMDEFRILPTGDVLEQLPGISPCFGNNPAYKVITIRQNDFTPTDYISYDYNLAATPAPAQFGQLYQFSETYVAPGTTLASSLTRLYPQLNSTGIMRDTYTLLYESGSTAVNTTNPTAETPWNPINDVNWPIFGCTIGNSDESDYLTCVGLY